MDEKPQSREGETKESRGPLQWFLKYWRISYLLGVQQDEPLRGLLRYWPLTVTLLAVVAVHVMLDDDIKVLPPFMLLANDVLGGILCLATGPFRISIYTPATSHGSMSLQSAVELTLGTSSSLY